MLAVPAAMPRETPEFGSTVAAEVLSELQVITVPGGSAWIVPSLNFSIAVKSVVVPVEMVIVEGVTTNEVAEALVTVKVAEPTMTPSQLVAVMLMGPPGATAVAFPVLSTVATAVLLLAQVT
jgi:hypothetical protein